MTDKKAERALGYLESLPWAILPESLNTILSIAERSNGNVDAVETKFGKPLNNTQMVSIRDGVAILPVIGPVMRYANVFTRISGATSIQILATDFTEALDNPSVSAIVLEIDSPGGTIAGVQEFSEIVYQARGKKPVIAYISDLGASAAYWIASAASQIVVSETARVGSIGVVTQLGKEDSDKTIQFVSSQSPNKRPDLNSEEGKSQIQKTVDALGEIFVSTVARNRGVSKETVLEEFGQGGVFVGKQAIKTGLVDKLGSLESVLAELSSENLQTNHGGKTKSMTTAEQQTTSNQITAEFISANHPSIAEQFRVEGAEQERQRIQAVESQSMLGHEALIQTLKFDGKTTGEQAAVQVLKAEKESRGRVLSSIQEEAPKPIPQPTVSDEGIDPNLPLEEKTKLEWSKSPSLREEFASYEAYYHYEKANADNKVKIKK